MMRSLAADGLLAVDKPAGITSHGVTDRLRRVLGTRRVGHAGTLDPFATGLLLLLVGRATRLLPFLDIEPKVYLATIRFGTATSTDDPEGEVLLQAPPPPQEVVERVIPSFTGDLLQRPPVFSAKRVAGVRAYAAARRGKPMDLQPVRVAVHEWRVIGRDAADLNVEIRCSGGTYIRALARDLGEAAGSAAHLAALRRIRTGRWAIDEASSMDDAERGEIELTAPAAMVAHLPRHDIDDLDARRVSHGQALASRGEDAVVALCHADDLVAIACRDGAEWRPKVVMRDSP
jgi:tRNA pseudouridine55 synthase